MATYTELEITPEPTPIVTLSEFKAQLKEVDPDAVHPEDVLFQSYLDIALEECESDINRFIQTRKFKISGKSFSEVITQSLHTIIAIDKIEYKPENYTSGDLTVLAPTNYSLQRVDNVENKVVYAENVTLPSIKEYTPDAVQLYITVGFTKIPKKVNQAMLLKAVAMDEMRGDYVKNKTTASERLLQKLVKY